MERYTPIFSYFNEECFFSQPLDFGVPYFHTDKPISVWTITVFCFQSWAHNFLLSKKWVKKGWLVKNPSQRYCKKRVAGEKSIAKLL